MGESHENLLKAVRHCQQSLDKYTENRDDSKLLRYLQRLHKLPIKVVHLEETGVGRTVNGLRKLGGDVGDSAKRLVSKWKDMVVGEQEEEDDDDDDDDDEDGYQTGDDESNSEEDTSSHRKSDSRSEDRSRKNKHSSSSEKSSRKEERHKRKHKHESESSSEEEAPRKHQKKVDEDRHRSRSEDESRHKSKKIVDSDSEEESRSKEKKQKSDKHRSDKKKSRESSLENENYKSSKSKERQKESGSRNKDKHKSVKKEDSKRHEHSSKTKDTEKKSRDKEKTKHKTEEKKEKSSKPKVANGSLTIEGIGSGSGASFAEALGMCEPSSSKSNPKKKPEKIEKKEKPAKVDEVVPKLLKEPTADPPLDLNLSSLLPPITPNYRPLGNLISSETQHKKFLSESEALSNSITSKNQRTKVYSGNKTIIGLVPSLFELCIRLLQDHIDALEYTGGVPYHLLKPILEKATPNQLYMMEHHNPYLIEDTDELWGHHCQREFRNKQKQEMETWRDMYLRCLDERDARLKALTANIKQAQDKTLPVRMTKLAYVDAVAKPPRNIARKQAKNGTAFDVRKPTMTPTARLASLATAGEAGKVAVPNPGSRAVERSSGHAAAKAKKAPLMLKSITSFKNRFKR